MPPLKPKDKSETIRIAGAGPSGLACAHQLLKAGYLVEVHEAKPVVGARWKKGFQLLENFSEDVDILDHIRGWGVDINFDATPIQDLTLWDGKKRKATFRTDRPLGYFVNRGSAAGHLDAGLLKQVQALGGKVHFNSRKKPNEVDIVATGPKRVDGIGKEVTFTSNLSDRMTVILDPELTPFGYAYLFVVKGEATLGMAVLQDYKRIDEYFDNTVERLCQIEDVNPQAIAKGEKGYLYANFFMHQTRDDEGRLFSGECAGFQDYLFGFGMRYAMQSGYLAARAISEGVSYDVLWKEGLEKKQMMSLWNRFFYEKFRTWLPSILILLAQRSGDVRRFMGQWYAPQGWKLSMVPWIKKHWKKRDIMLKKEDLYGSSNLSTR